MAKWIRRLTERAGKGYGLAIVEPAAGKVGDPRPDLLARFEKDGIPVLAEARGALGVLRALDIPGRRSGILRSLAASCEEVDIAHWTPEDPQIIHWWRVKVHPTTEPNAVLTPA